MTERKTQSPPSAIQWSARQHPLLQVLPAQQLSPGLPHFAHKPSVPVIAGEQMAPATQASVSAVAGQQVSPSPPQVEQAPLRQSRPVAHVGVALPQQGWFLPPQSAQCPATQVPPEVPPSAEAPLLQAPLSATQRPSKQQPLASQVLPAQQAEPGLPQAAHSE